MIGPAVKGTHNVLEACVEAKIKRVVVVSSVAAVFSNPSWPRSRVMDESCWSDTEHCRASKVLKQKYVYDFIWLSIFIVIPQNCTRTGIFWQKQKLKVKPWSLGEDVGLTL